MLIHPSFILVNILIKRIDEVYNLITGGPYSAFAGKDATRGLATGQVAASDKEYDDCSDLAADEIASAKEWEEQFRGKLFIVFTHFILTSLVCIVNI